MTESQHSDSGVRRAGVAAAGSADELFEHWCRGDGPTIRTLLARASELTPSQLSALVRADQVDRWRRGEPIAIEKYLEQYPALERDPEHAVDLIYAEFLLREEMHDSPLPQQYLQRFPQFAIQLELQFEFRRALRRDPSSRQRTTVSAPATPATTDGSIDSFPAPDGSLMETSPVAPPGYELLGPAFRGGMGVVVKARQTKLNRVVALKMIRSGALASGEELRRFYTEARAAAKLDHPGIVPIFEVAESAGQPYFSMAFVDGTSLSERLAAGPLRPLEAATILRDVAEAVDYAHQQGVIHRDIKPSNILLDWQARPRITDFGLAKRVEGDASATVTGQILGTPAYMPPEQAAGRLREVGPAADVYALGATLYHLLAGRPPFQAAELWETVRQVLETEPISPRRLNPVVPRDLETICLKCLQKVPAQRYPSARALADDLGRFLHGEPIRARATNTTERIWRWCRRKPAVATLTAALLSAFLIGPASVFVQWQRAETNAVLAARRATDADQQRKLAEESFLAARKAGDQFYTLMSEQLLYEEPGLQSVRKKLLEAALTYYQGLLQQWADDPRMQADLAAAHNRVGAITSLIGSKQDAHAAFRQAVEIQQQLFDSDPAAASDLRSNLGHYYLDLAMIETDIGQPDEAQRHLEQARRIFEQSPPPVGPESVDWQHRLALTYINMGTLERAVGRPKDAAGSYHRGKSILEGLVSEQPGRLVFRVDLASTLQNHGLVLLDLGQWAEAIPDFERARDVATSLASEKPKVWQFRRALASATYLIGLARTQLGQRAEALEAMRDCCAIRESLVRDDPQVILLQRDLAASYEGLGNLLDAPDQRSEALRYHELARDVREKLVQSNAAVTEFRRELAFSLINIGVVRSDLGDHSAALESYQHAAELLGPLAATNPENPEYASTLGGCWHNIADALVQLRRLEEAASSLRRAIEHQKAALDRAPEVVVFRQRLSAHYRDLAAALRDSGQRSDAIATALKCRDLWPKNPTELYKAARTVASCLPTLGQGKTELSETEQAESARFAEQAVQLLREAIEAGYRDFDQLLQDREFASIRERPDFAKLIADNQR